jgi:2-oxoglutarate dehydrogenase E2 component (dihydrolipoamide succinyltransferase)
MATAAPRARALLRAAAAASRPSSLAAQSAARRIPSQIRPLASVPYRVPHAASPFALNARSLYATPLAFDAEPLGVPEMGESITEGTIVGYMKAVGEHVEEDDIVAQIETDKITVDVRAPKQGVITEILAEDGDVVQVGQPIASIDYDPANAAKVLAASDPPPGATSEPVKPDLNSPARQESSRTSTVRADEPPAKPAEPKPKAAKEVQPTLNMSESGERRVAMTRMRKRIAERLKEAQNTAAMLTTFSEIDMSALMDLRREFKDAFEKKHGAKLGFMSAFVKACTVALGEQPEVNAFIDGNDIVYRDYVDISVAVSTPKGLVVPAIRGCENMNFAAIEKTIVSLGERARKGELTIDEMQGGTFTISNGGVFGSLLSTPIINMPQSAILGMHIIQKRPVVVDDEIVIRPMMYVALSYDHRLIDGREAVTFLRRVKTLIEDPHRFMLVL